MTRRRTALASSAVATLLLPAGLTLAPPASAAACTDTWNDVGASGSWSDPTAWVDGTTPAADDHVCLPAGDYAVSVDGAAVAASVAIGADAGTAHPRLAVGMGLGTSTSLIVSGPVTAHGELALVGDGDATVTAGDIQVWGRATVDPGGVRTIDASVTVAAGGLLAVTGAELVAGVDSLTSAGTVDLGIGSALFAEAPISITGGLVVLDGSIGSLVLDGGRLTGDGNVGGTLTNHAGTIDPSGGDGDRDDPVGDLTVNQSFVQTGGVLHVDVLGTGAGQHDRVTVDATASVSGTVDVAAVGMPLPDVIAVSSTWLDLNVPIAVTGVPDSWVTRTLGQLRIEAEPFRSDVPLDHPFVLDIAWTVGDDVMVGYPDGTWRPAAGVTRQAVAAVFYRMAGSPRGATPTCTEMPFPDVLVDHAFCGEIDWAGDQGVLRGYDDGTFRPTHPATRQSLVAGLYRLAGEPWGATPPCEAAPFPDVPLSHPFCGELAWAADLGLVQGFDDGTARPAAALSRQATAAMLHRYDLLPT